MDKANKEYSGSLMSLAGQKFLFFLTVLNRTSRSPNTIYKLPHYITQMHAKLSY